MTPYRIDRTKDFRAQPESTLLAMLGYGEARGEPPDGMLAVMHVVLNRAEKSGRRLPDEILWPLQFSCFNENDPNRTRLMLADKDEPLPWGAAYALAILVLAGVTIDPTHGARNYYATGMLAPPSWATAEKGWKLHGQIGNHTFGVAA